MQGNPLPEPLLSWTNSALEPTVRAWTGSGPQIKENEKMMRSLTVVMLLILAIGLVACGGNPTPTPTTAPTEAPPAEPTEAAEVEPPPATEEPAATEEPVVGPTTVEVVGQPATASGMVNINWLWSELVDTTSAAAVTVSNPASYVLVFMNDGTVNITADCNIVLGTYTIDGTAISIQLGPSTRAFCGEQSMDQQFLNLLSTVTSGTLDGGRLLLYTADNAARMGFTNGGSSIDLAAEVGIAPNQISLDTQGLPYSWQPVLVPESPYDESQPPGPMGMPAHMQILFGVTDPAARQPGDPVMYIIPVAAYEEMWVEAGNDSVSSTMDDIWALTFALPYPPPTSGMPALPVEEFSAVNDLAVQLGRTTPTDLSATKNGYRFVGRWVQDANPVTNQGLRYVYQGFTNDGEYLVSFAYPVSTSALPNDVSQVSEETMNRFNEDPQAHISEQAALLNGLTTADWAPDLATLDALVASLQIAPVPSSGLPGITWQYVANNFDGLAEIPVDVGQTNVVSFNQDGTLNYVADCNVGSGTYAISGGLMGSIGIELGATTLAACSDASLGPEFTSALAEAQEFRIRPGGLMMDLVQPVNGGYIVLRNLGPAEASGPVVELPEPPADGITGEIIAPAGANVRTGPGTNFPVLGTAPFGATGEVIGQSADGQWYVTPLPNVAGGQGWVSASLVAISGEGEIPVVASPPPPATPVPTATPLPTATPSPTIVFTADSTTINQGQCTTLRWSVQNVQAVWVYPVGQPFDQFPVTGDGSMQVCPTFTTTYELRVLRTDGIVELRQVTVNVIVTNPLANSSWIVSTINVNQIPVGATLTLSFTSDSVSAFGGCNNFNGPYVVSGGSISIGPLGGTLSTCGPELDAQEQIYTGLLQSATSYQLNGNQLILRDGAGFEIIRLSRTG